MGKAKEASEMQRKPGPTAKAADASFRDTNLAERGGNPTHRVDILEAAKRLQPGEPEDAYLTGDRRSLRRRLLGLNMPEMYASQPAKTTVRAVPVVPLPVNQVNRPINPSANKRSGKKPHPTQLPA